MMIWYDDRCPGMEPPTAEQVLAQWFARATRRSTSAGWTRCARVEAQLDVLRLSEPGK
jgi:hypothetical protein